MRYIFPVPSGLGLGSLLPFLNFQSIYFWAGICASIPRKSDSRKYSRRDLCNGLKSSPSTWVTCCTKATSHWRNFCRPLYAPFRCLCATPVNILKQPSQYQTVLPINPDCGTASRMYPPNYFLTVTMVRTRAWENISSCMTLCVGTTKILLVSSRKYPLGVPAP